MGCKKSELRIFESGDVCNEPTMYEAYPSEGV
jgi:hypothetical protein